jgi:6-phosphogluconolactonase/glucosamine-6-phosphate isomerase/deaminase
VFLVTGKKKAEIVKKIIKRLDFPGIFPASLVKPDKGVLRWLLDNESGSLL